MFKFFKVISVFILFSLILYGTENTIVLEKPTVSAGGNVSLGSVTTNITSTVPGGIIVQQTVQQAHLIQNPSLASEDDSQFIDNVRLSFDVYGHLLNASIGKDITILLGRTGAGKSTLINYLCQKALITNENNDIILQNQNDPEAAPIGIRGISETQYPKSLLSGENNILFDIPGLDGTGNSACHFMNALFIREIILKALSVKVIFVIGEDDITSGRGTYITNFFEKINNVFKDEMQKIMDSSILVISKWDTTKRSSPERFCEGKVEPSAWNIIRIWFEKKYVFIFNKPTSDQINPDQRGPILGSLGMIQSHKILTCKTESIFSFQREKIIRGVLKSILNASFENDFTVPDDNFDEIKYFFKTPNEEHFFKLKENLIKNNIVDVIVSVSPQLFDKAFLEFKLEKNHQLDKIKGQLKIKLGKYYFNEGIQHYFSLSPSRLEDSSNSFKEAAIRYDDKRAYFNLAIITLNQAGRPTLAKELFLKAGVDEQKLEILWNIDVWKAFKESTLRRFHLNPPNIYFKSDGLIGSAFSPISKLLGAKGPSEDKKTRLKIADALFHMLSLMPNLESLIVKNYITDIEIPELKKFLTSNLNVKELDFIPSYLDRPYDREGFLTWLLENGRFDMMCNI
ncbi:MAG: hypothetical protein HEEMFOPI_01831 [Holosporales bacterium]